MANAPQSLPQISAAFRQSRVSYSNVRPMTRVATPENESDLLNIALYGTAVHVEKLVRAYPRAREAEALDAANLCHAKRTLTWYHDDDGSVVFHCRIELETGASRWGGETMDYDVAIHALFEADGGLGKFSSRT